MSTRIKSQDPRQWKRAKEMRNDPSMGEAALWKHFQRSQTGVRFRRQAAIGPFILDFYAPSLKLCIEVDGEQHDPVVDARRDAYLAKMGIETVRIPSLHLLDAESLAHWVNEIHLEVQRRQGVPPPANPVESWDEKHQAVDEP